MNRRAFFAALIAPFLGRFAPKPKPTPLGVSIRTVRYFDVVDKVSRFDALCGFGAIGAIKPELTRSTRSF